MVYIMILDQNGIIALKTLKSYNEAWIRTVSNFSSNLIQKINKHTDFKICYNRVQYLGNMLQKRM